MSGRTLLARLLAATTLATAPAAFAAEPTEAQTPASTSADHATPAAPAAEQAAPSAEATALASPAAPTPAASDPYSSAETTIGTLLDNPAAKAVLEKHAPQLLAIPSLENARPMTLKQAQAQAGAVLSDKVLARIDADLAKVPVG